MDRQQLSQHAVTQLLLTLDTKQQQFEFVESCLLAACSFSQQQQQPPHEASDVCARDFLALLECCAATVTAAASAARNTDTDTDKKKGTKAKASKTAAAAAAAAKSAASAAAVAGNVDIGPCALSLSRLVSVLHVFLGSTSATIAALRDRIMTASASHPPSSQVTNISSIENRPNYFY